MDYVPPPRQPQREALVAVTSHVGCDESLRHAAIASGSSCTLAAVPRALPRPQTPHVVSSSSSGSSREQGVEVRLKFAVTVLPLSMYTVVTRVVLLKSPDRWLNVAEKPRTHFPAGA